MLESLWGTIGAQEGVRRRRLATVAAFAASPWPALALVRRAIPLRAERAPRPTIPIVGLGVRGPLLALRAGRGDADLSRSRRTEWSRTAVHSIAGTHPAPPRQHKRPARGSNERRANRGGYVALHARRLVSRSRRPAPTRARSTIVTSTPARPPSCLSPQRPLTAARHSAGRASRLELQRRPYSHRERRRPGTAPITIEAALAIATIEETKRLARAVARPGDPSGGEPGFA